MKYLLLSLSILTACGVDTTGKNDDNQGAYVNSGGVQDAPNEREIVTEYRKDGDRLAIMLADTADLPVCNNANSGQLAYVKSVNKFFSCANTVWGEISIQGAPGEKGAKGEKGEPGPEAQPRPVNAWRDPISGSEWIIGGLLRQEAIFNSPPCTGDFRLPSAKEAEEAAAHGLFVAASAIDLAYTEIWVDYVDACTQRPEMGCRSIVRKEGYMNPPSSLTAAVACIRK